MAISGRGHVSVENDSRLREKLSNFFNGAIYENQTIADWYRQVTEYRREKTNVILSMVMNKIIGKLMEYVEPF